MNFFCKNILFFLAIVAPICAQDSKVILPIDKRIINDVKVLRGERSILNNKKSFALGAAMVAGAALAGTLPLILDPEYEIQLYRGARDYNDDDTMQRVFDTAEKASVVAIPSIFVGAGAGVLYSALKKRYILSNINTLLQLYTHYSSFKNLTLLQSALVYAAYQQDIKNLKILASKMPTFLNEKGVFNVITRLYYRRHATINLMDTFKKLLQIPDIEVAYMPDYLAKPTIWQRAKEAGNSGVAKLKEKATFIGGKLSKVQHALVRPFKLNNLSANEFKACLARGEKIEAFLAKYSPNVFVGSMYEYISGRATPALGYALWHGYETFAMGLINNGANLEDPAMHKRSLYANKAYSNYMQLAIDKKQLSIIKQLAAKGIKFGNRELEYAFTSPDAAIQSYFKDAIKNPQLVKEAIYPLHIAVLAGNIQLAENLLSFIPIDSLDNEGNTSLHYAVQKSRTNIVQFLIKRGALTTIKNKEGNTPLHVARDSNIAEFLLQHGALSHAKNFNGKIPLHLGLRQKNKALIDVLSRDVDLTIRDNDNNNFLHYALEYNNNDFAANLIERYASLINGENKKGITPLMSASQRGNNIMVEQLIAKGAQINARDSSGRTPLLIAIANNNTDAARILLKYAPDASIANNNGENCLHYALKYNHVDLIDECIQCGASISKADSKGNLPLHIAAFQGSSDATLIKLISPMVINIANADGYIPLHVAKNNRVLHFLLKSGSYPDTPLKHNNTLLHEAAKKYDQEKVGLLLMFKANPNIINNQGDTPLHCALSSANNYFLRYSDVVGTVSRLVNSYVVTVKNNNGYTPLHLAAAIKNDQLCIALIKILYNYGARADILDYAGKYPYEYTTSDEVRKLLGYIPPVANKLNITNPTASALQGNLYPVL